MQLVLFQEKRYSCGPAALRAALYTLGHRVSESAIRRIANTTPSNGTSELGLFRAIRHYGHGYKEFIDKSPVRGWNRIKRHLNQGLPSLLCISVIEEEDHWVSAVGLNGGNIMIFDPENPESKSKKYSGLQIVDLDNFYSKWAFTDNGHVKYYSLTITKE